MKYNKHPSTRPILCGISNIRWVIVGVIVGVLVDVSWLGRWVGGRPGSIRTRKAAQAEQLATLSLLDDHLAGARLRLTPGHPSCSSTRARHRAPPSRQADSDNSSSPSCTLGQNDSLLDIHAARARFLTQRRPQENRSGEQVDQETSNHPVRN